MNNYSLYLHRNLINNKVYVGITKQKCQNRWRKDGAGYKNQEKFWDAIQKFGWNNFSHTVLFENLSAEEASKKEQELIKFFDSIQNGYNVSPGGLPTNHSPQTKEKIRKKMLGKTHTQATKDKISKSKSNTKKAVYCIETGIQYESLSDAEKNTKIDKSSISKACKGQVYSAGGYHWCFVGQEPIVKRSKREREVICISTGTIYNSISEAARLTNSDPSNIYKVCNGKYKTTKGLKWAYYNRDGGADEI